MADYNSDRTGSNIDLTLDKVDALDAKVQPTATGANVTGTLVADRLTVESGSPVFTIHNTLTSQFENNLIGKIDFEGSDASSNSSGVRASIQATVNNTVGATSLDFYTRDSGSNPLTKGLTVSRYNDVSFYEDTGTTAKMVWSSSAESLGIGTNSPSYPIHGETTGSGTTSGSNTVLFLASQASGRDVNIRMGDGVNATARIGYDTGHLYAFTNGSERMRIDSAGNVGIGTASPSAKFQVKTTTGRNFKVDQGTSNKTILSNDYNLTLKAGGGYSLDLDTGNSAGVTRFLGNATERARIDSSGNLLVGKASTTLSVAGTTLFGDGVAYHTVSNNTPLRLNRLGNDGTILDLRKDGATVGSIGAQGSELTISGGTGRSGLRMHQSTILPLTNSSLSDATESLGQSNYRFKDLYLSGGVYLGGTGAANKLDDYETGTFTPSYVPSSSGQSVTYTNQSGYYTKVGNLVTFTAFIQFATVTSMGAGTIRIYGLPFSASLATSERGRASLSTSGVSFTSGTTPHAYFQDGMSYCGAVIENGGVSESVATVANFVFSAGDTIAIYGSYKV